MKRLKTHKHLLHVLKNATPKVRKVIIQGADDDLIKALVECVINTLNGNHKVSTGVKGKLGKFRNCLRKLSCSKVPLKVKRKILVQKGGFLGVLLTSLLSGIVGRLLETKE
jgi:hypothetical protein